MRHFLTKESTVDFGIFYISNKISRIKFVKIFGRGQPFEKYLIKYPVSKSFIDEDGNEYMVSFSQGARNVSRITMDIGRQFLDSRDITNHNEKEWDEISNNNKKVNGSFLFEFENWLISKGCGY